MHVTPFEPTEAERWDEFLEAQEEGQFQQTTFWARAKEPEGWRPFRLLLRQDQQIVGGVQVLVKQTRLGRVGFVSKGPVVGPGAESGLRQLHQSLIQAQREQGWLALVLQAPDRAQAAGPEPGLGFLRERMLGVIQSTLVVDLSVGREAVQAGFRRTVRKEIRQAQERGVSIVEGQEAELPAFFALMDATCRRQQTKPNPPDLPATQALWKAFAARGQARLHFAVHEGRKLAGGLSLFFGPRATFWKKGWSQTETELHANTLLTSDAIRWAADHGYRGLDFVVLDRDIAEAMTQKRELPADAPTRRDWFNLGFGGQGWLLPPAWIRFRNPAWSVLYRVAASRVVRSMLRRDPHQSPRPRGERSGKSLPNPNVL